MTHREQPDVDEVPEDDILGVIYFLAELPSYEAIGKVIHAGADLETESFPFAGGTGFPMTTWGGCPSRSALSG